MGETGWSSVWFSRGTRLRRLRDQMGVEQREAAAAIGISPAYLSMLENDKKGTNVDQIRGTIERTARYYGVIPEYLLADSPQEYMSAFVQSAKVSPGLETVGTRLRYVLDELYLRWGERFSLNRVADALGIKVETLMSYLEDQVPMTDESVIAHLTALTGVPIGFFLPSAEGAPEDDPAIRRVITLAVKSGISVEELEHVIQAWMIARSHKTT